MKKIYILALTFFALFCGQVSYGQGFNSENYNDLLKAFGLPNFENIKGDSAMYIQLDEVVVSSEPRPVPIDWDYSGNTTDYNNNTDPFDQANTSNVSDPNAPCPTPTCPPGHSAVGCDCVVNTWYLDFDGDGYHSTTYDAAISPGSKWSLSTKGEDCDDARSQYTTVCCTKVCESGYKLNEDTCECKLLLPCFGTIKDYETSNSFNSVEIFNELNSSFGDFGIATDVMDMLNESKVFDPKVIAQSTDIATHANAIGNIGDASQVIMSYFEYIDEPSTQNLLKFALDSVSPFLSPAASLALSTIDLYKDSNGDSKLDLLLRAAGDYIDRQSDCNLGLGVRNAVF